MHRGSLMSIVFLVPLGLHDTDRRHSAAQCLGPTGHVQECSPGRLRGSVPHTYAARFLRSTNFSAPYLPFCPFSILAQVSRSVTVRLNTSAPGRVSRSAQK